MADRLESVQAALAARYRIERELGHGGMATVYLAQDLKHHRSVAVKVLHPELAAALGAERFLREIEVAAQLQHPHILPLHDSDAAGGLLYFVMPYVEGESLRQRLEREKQLPVEDALKIAREVASALDYAHRHGVIHRDIKPENIVLSGGEAMVLDFGIARAIDEAAGQKLTTTGLMVGTPGYMSPEQAMAGGTPDARSDVYSLGCVLFEMLGGEPPFTGPTTETVLYQHINALPPDIRGLRPSVPAEVERALARALAKLPADRFATAGQFGDALASTHTLASGLGVPRLRTRARRSRWLVAAAVLVVAAAGLWGVSSPAVSKLFGARADVKPATKDWIIVAEFDGPSDDPDLAVATRELVSAALDESRVVAPVPKDQLQLALQMAGKPPTTRIDADLARELAYRRSVRAVVEGRIARLGQGYTIVVRVVDVDSARVVLSVSDVASNAAALVSTVGRIARKLREGLGERGKSIRASRALTEAMTPSFEAYRKYVKARELVNGGDARAGIVPTRDALVLDPDFAMAWCGIGVAYNNLGKPDSGLAAFREALRRPERLTDRQRLLIEGSVAGLRGDLAAELEAYDRVLESDAFYASVHSARGRVLFACGRGDEALAAYDQAAALSPFGPSRIQINSRIGVLVSLGRLEEARQVARDQEGRFGQLHLIRIAELEGDWANVESLGTALAANPTANSDTQKRGHYAAVGARAARGAVGAADRLLQRLESVDEAEDPLLAGEYDRERLMLSLMTGGVVGHPNCARHRDTTTWDLVTRGLCAAVTGDTLGARRFLRIVRARPKDELARQGAGPALLEAWIAAAAGRWEQTIQILGPPARQGIEIGFLDEPAGRVPMGWLMADAYEHLGRPDSAAAYLERALSPLGRDAAHLRGYAFSFFHRRLVLLYARLGRLEDARRHWEVFSQTFTRPDPEMVPLIAEARAALVSAEGMARSTAR